LKVGHQERGGESFARNVGNAKSQRIGAKRQDIEIVATDNACRLPRAGDLVPGELWDFFREKSLLDGTRLGNFLLLLSELESNLLVI
jgi:hypothetical protein